MFEMVFQWVEEEMEAVAPVATTVKPPEEREGLVLGPGQTEREISMMKLEEAHSVEVEDDLEVGAKVMHGPAGRSAFSFSEAKRGKRRMVVVRCVWTAGVRDRRK